MKSNLIMLVTAAISLAAIPGASSQCFFPNGRPTEEYGYNLEPCSGRNTTWQQCCEFGDICTENGICVYSEDHITPTIFYRAGCTNRDWSGCPQVCPHGEFIVETLHGEISLDRCDTGKYCCHDEYIDCCEHESQQFSLSVHNPGTKNKTDATKRVTIGAVGGALGGLAMIGGAVGVWLYLRKKKVKKGEEAAAQDEITGRPETKQVLEMGASSVGGQKCTAGADIKAHPTVVEMDSTLMVLEMDSSVVHELGA